MPSIESKANNKMERHLFATHTVEKDQLSLVCRMLTIHEKMIGQSNTRKRDPGYNRRGKGKERHEVNKGIKVCSASSSSKETQIKMKYFFFFYSSAWQKL